MLSTLTSINNVLYKVTSTLCGALLAIFALCVFVQVVTRNYIHYNLPWTAELSLLCFVWGVMLGSAVAVRSSRHYVVDLLPQSCSGAVQILDILAVVVCLGIFCIMVTAGYDFAMLGLSRRGNSVPISMAWTFSSIPVSGLFMILFGTEVLWKKILDLKEGTCHE